MRSLEKQLDKSASATASDASETEAQRKSRDVLEQKVRELEAKLESEGTKSVGTTSPTSTSLEQELAAFKARCDEQTLALFDAALKYVYWAPPPRPLPHANPGSSAVSPNRDWASLWANPLCPGPLRAPSPFCNH